MQRETPGRQPLPQQQGETEQCQGREYSAQNHALFLIVMPRCRKHGVASILVCSLTLRLPVQASRDTVKEFRQNDSTAASSNYSGMQDEAELTRLYDEHAQALFAFLLNFTRDETDTRDLMQEVFVRLAREPGLLRRARDERAFLIRSAHNAAIDLMRRRGARQKRREQLASEPAPVFAATSDPDEAAFRAALSSALAELPSDQRAVVYLKLWEGLTFEKIAEALDLSPNTAASRYRYGLDKLRQRLRPLYDEIK